MITGWVRTGFTGAGCVLLVWAYARPSPGQREPFYLALAWLLAALTVDGAPITLGYPGVLTALDVVIIALRLASIAIAVRIVLQEQERAKRFAAAGLAAYVLGSLPLEVEEVVLSRGHGFSWLRSAWPADFHLAFLVVGFAFMVYAAVIARDLRMHRYLFAGLSAYFAMSFWVVASDSVARHNLYRGIALTPSSFLVTLGCITIAIFLASTRKVGVIAGAVAIGFALVVLPALWNASILGVRCGFGVPRIPCAYGVTPVSTTTTMPRAVLVYPPASPLFVGRPPHGSPPTPSFEPLTPP